MLSVLHRRWATCGVLIALATLTWQPVFFAAIAMACVGVLLAPERRMRALARVLPAAPSRAASCSSTTPSTARLHTFFECFVLINAQYTPNPAPFDTATTLWLNLEAGFGPRSPSSPSAR